MRFGFRIKREWANGDGDATLGTQRERLGIIRQQQFEAAYVFGAVCPTEGKAVSWVMPKAKSDSMQQHLNLIAAAITAGKQAVLVVDQAAWHVTEKWQIPANLFLLPLPPYSPELLFDEVNLS